MPIWSHKYSYQNKVFLNLAKVIDLIGAWLLFFKTKPELSSQKIKKILVVKLDNLGDCFLLLPLFAYLQKLNSNVVVDSLSLTSSEIIFKNCSDINQCYSVDNRLDILKKRFRQKIKENNYDLIIDARGYFVVALFGFWLKIPHRFGFAEEVGQFFYTKLFYINQSRQQVCGYFKILAFLNIKIDEWQPRLVFKNCNNSFTGLLEFGRKIIAIHPTASQSYKYWPLDYWFKLIDFLLKRYQDCQIVLLSGLGEKDFVDRLENKFLNYQSRLINLAGQLNLLESYYLISKASLFVGNDSVLGHFAGSFNLPTLILMNRAVNSQRWSPLGAKTKVFKALENEHQCLFDKCDYFCQNMVDVKPVEIINYIAELEF